MSQQCFPLLVPIATSDQSVMEEEDHGRRKEVANEIENWTQRIERGVGGVMNADEKSILPSLTTVTHPHRQHQCQKKGICEFAFAALQCKQFSFGTGTKES